MANVVFRTVGDEVFLIRDWTDARGCGAWRMLAMLAGCAERIVHYDETHPEHRTQWGEIIGGETSAALARKAARRYRLASWVLRMVYDGREAHDRAVALATEAAEETRIAAL